MSILSELKKYSPYQNKKQPSGRRDPRISHLSNRVRGWLKAPGGRPPKWQTYWGVVAGAGARGAEGTRGQGGPEWGPGSRAKPLPPKSDCVFKDATGRRRRPVTSNNIRSNQITSALSTKLKITAIITYLKGVKFQNSPLRSASTRQ